MNELFWCAKYSVNDIYLHFNLLSKKKKVALQAQDGNLKIVGAFLREAYQIECKICSNRPEAAFYRKKLFFIFLPQLFSSKASKVYGN